MQLGLPQSPMCPLAHTFDCMMFLSAASPDPRRPLPADPTTTTIRTLTLRPTRRTVTENTIAKCRRLTRSMTCTAVRRRGWRTRQSSKWTTRIFRIQVDTIVPQGYFVTFKLYTISKILPDIYISDIQLSASSVLFIAFPFLIVFQHSMSIQRPRRLTSWEEPPRHRQGTRPLRRGTIEELTVIVQYFDNQEGTIDATDTKSGVFP